MIFVGETKINKNAKMNDNLVETRNLYVMKNIVEVNEFGNHKGDNKELTKYSVIIEQC